MRTTKSIIVVMALFLNGLSFPRVEASDFILPQAGAMVSTTPPRTPAYLKGMIIDPKRPLSFDFIVYRGDHELLASQKNQEYTKLIKYFLAALAVPDQDQWVNLSPYEKDRIVPQDFGQTLMGQDLLAEDYILKQLSSSLLYPESKLGKTFWSEVYQRSKEQLGTTQVSVNTYNKVWILPDSAVVYQQGNAVYVLHNHLKVMMDEDYLSLKEHRVGSTHSIGSQVMRTVIIPTIEKEVNEGANFALLRQVYSGMLLATWYKRTLRKSFLSRIYVNQGKIKGLTQDPRNNQFIYGQYLKAFKKGVFNMIREDYDPQLQKSLPRKYFSGGAKGYDRALINETSQLPEDEAAIAAKEDDVRVDLQTAPVQASRYWAQQFTQDNPVVSISNYLIVQRGKKYTEQWARNARWARVNTYLAKYYVKGVSPDDVINELVFTPTQAPNNRTLRDMVSLKPDASMLGEALLEKIIPALIPARQGASHADRVIKAAEAGDIEAAERMLEEPWSDITTGKFSDHPNYKRALNALLIAYALRARQAILAGRYDEAIQMIQQLENHHPPRNDVAYSYAMAIFDKDVEAYLMAITEHPEGLNHQQGALHIHGVSGIDFDFHHLTIRTADHQDVQLTYHGFSSIPVLLMLFEELSKEENYGSFMELGSTQKTKFLESFESLTADQKKLLRGLGAKPRFLQIVLDYLYRIPAPVNSQPSDSASLSKGGIDMNAEALHMTIEGQGMDQELSDTFQDTEQVSVDGLLPKIRSIRPAVLLPLFSSPADSKPH